MKPIRKTLRDHVREFERKMVVDTLQRNNGDRSKTAEALGVTERGLEKILQRHHMSKRRFTKPLPFSPSETKREGAK